MKKFMKQFLFITIFSLSTLLLFIKLARGSIEPWHTVCFSSIPTKDSINGDTEQIKKVSEKYPQYFIQNTFINVRTEATNQTVYDGENPYRFTFRFWTLDGEKSFCPDEHVRHLPSAGVRAFRRQGRRRQDGKREVPPSQRHDRFTARDLREAIRLNCSRDRPLTTVREPSSSDGSCAAITTFCSRAGGRAVPVK